jgi:DNA polymerase II large subunit
MDIIDYYRRLENESRQLYAIAGEARSLGLDPETTVESPLTKDLAARVEGLVGPPGVAERIRELLKENSREKCTLFIIREIAEGKFGEFSNEDKAIQCIKTGLTILTEGVTAAGTEGVSRARICENPDGSKYLSVYFAGPIRSAGGKAAGQAVMIADFTRRLMELENYRPTDTEIERYIEEINIYHNSIAHMQYKPSDDEVRYILRNCPICIDGDPSEQVEVSIYKNLKRVETNRIRSGICLVIGEGIAQKAASLLKFSRKHDLGWNWLEGLIKVEKKSGEEDTSRPLDKYLGDIVGGRPIFAYPSTPGGFRLRYGRCRNSGIAAKCIHPAAMVVLDEFPAVGTQFKVERPGKGAAITPCDTIEPPVVRLRGGEVAAISDCARARELAGDVEEILFLGDMLVSYGDFLKSNHHLLPSAWCEEWWMLLAGQKGVRQHPRSAAEAVELSERHGLPLHPHWTYFYDDLSGRDILRLIGWLSSGDIQRIEGLEKRQTTRLAVPVSEEKRLLERLCVPHRVIEGRVVIEDADALVKTLGLPRNPATTDVKPSGLETIAAIAPFKVMSKAPTYIGARMGRPEKAKERLMTPAPHGLVPVGISGGKVRSIIKAAEKGSISAELPSLVCPKCGRAASGYKCGCGGRAVIVRLCSKCGRPGGGEQCACGGSMISYKKTVINMKEALDNAAKRLGEKPDPQLKGVIGTTNTERFSEPVEKAILRAKHHVHVFKDGTMRFDATDVPLTHFRPCEVGVSVDRLRQLGYDRDCYGRELKEANQVLELAPQDVLLSEGSIPFFVNATKFLDDLLVKFYGLPPFYRVADRDGLVGQLVIGLAPHTSVGVLGRVVGFTRARVGYAHPYFHAAKRRNCDGDEDSLMLLLDVLLNFSKHYLPEKRGGSMDACLVLTFRIDPSEIDDEVHCMEIAAGYPLEFYETTQKKANPADIRVEVVAHRLGKPEQYHGFMFTHDTSFVDSGPTVTNYTKLKTMEEKVNSQLRLGERIRAVDERDVASRVLNFHFMRDIYGNLRAFGQQKFRCVDCNAKYRRVPLAGKCSKCGGKLLLTVSKGGIEKYLKISQQIADRYGLSDYMKQRLALVEKDLETIFQEEKESQQSLASFI